MITEKYCNEILQQYPEYITKDQMYRICHISKKTCLFLLESGLVPNIDSGKKTRRFKIKTVDVIQYLKDRDDYPELFKAPDGFYKGKGGDKKAPSFDEVFTQEDLIRMRQYYERLLKNNPDVMSVEQVAQFTGYNKNSVSRWCGKKELKCFYIKQRYQIPKEYELCGEMTELEGGVYQMTELRYGKYFVREKTVPDGFVLDDGVYGVSIEENGKTYTVENKAGVGFINDAQKGSLKIVKTSSDGKVEGFSFRVTSADGYDQTFKTDKNGEIFIEGLRIGEYTVSEVSDSASAGYILPADKQATVKTDSTTIVEMHNEFRDTPKTGEGNAQNPSLAKTEKSPQSEPISEQPKKSAEGATMTKEEKPSVREELRKIKESRKEQEADISSALGKSSASDRVKKQPAGKTEHKQPQIKKKKPKSKETR